MCIKMGFFIGRVVEVAGNYRGWRCYNVDDYVIYVILAVIYSKLCN